MTALHLACKNNSLEITEGLWLKDANIEVASKYINFPNHIATNYNVETVQFLLKNGAYVDAKNAEGCTALHLVVKLGFSETAEGDSLKCGSEEWDFADQSGGDVLVVGM